MDGYFARLAQRSDVAPVTAASRTPGEHSTQHRLGDGLEQDIEVTVPHVDVSAPPLAASDAASLAFDTETSRQESPSRSSDPAPVAKPDPNASVNRSANTAMPFESHVSGRAALPDDSMQPPHRAAVPSAWDVPPADRATADARFAATAAPLAPEQALASTPIATSNTSVRSSTSPLQQPTTSTLAASAPPHAAWTADDVGAPPLQSTTRAEPPVSMPSERATRAEPDLHDRAATSATAVSARATPRPPAPTAEPRADAARNRAAPQVHIGRIELEVRNSTPTPPAPTPADIAPPSPRSAAFNPHRHYLRGV